MTNNVLPSVRLSCDVERASSETREYFDEIAQKSHLNFELETNYDKYRYAHTKS